MSGTFQALQSYRYEDIIWGINMNYAPCLQFDSEKITIDLDRFHEIEHIPPTPAQLRSLRTFDSIYQDEPDDGAALESTENI